MEQQDLFQGLVLSGLITGLLLVVPFWRMFARAGLSSPLSLTVFLPLVGPLVSLLLLALKDWPVLSKGPR